MAAFADLGTGFEWGERAYSTIEYEKSRQLQGLSDSGNKRERITGVGDRSDRILWFARNASGRQRINKDNATAHDVVAVIKR